jgi:hypothetical protein
LGGDRLHRIEIVLKERKKYQCPFDTTCIDKKAEISHAVKVSNLFQT